MILLVIFLILFIPIALRIVEKLAKGGYLKTIGVGFKEIGNAVNRILFPFKFEKKKEKTNDQIIKDKFSKEKIINEKVGAERDLVKSEN